MKKYLLTENQVEMLNNIACVLELEGIRNITESLKPIEPLSEKELWDMAADHFDDEASYAALMAYAHDIKRRILGEQK